MQIKVPGIKYIWTKLKKMWFFTVLFSLSSVNYSYAIECICPEGKSTQADYYWRDYVGAIPKDAVDGGYTETGNKTYVGQMGTHIHRGIFPVNIIPGILGGVASIATKTYEDDYVKILCSGRHKEFEWKSSSADELHMLTDYHLIVGGSEGKAVTHIGRANFIGQVQIGRVYTRELKEKGLWLYNKDGAQVNFQTFEILVLPRN